MKMFEWPWSLIPATATVFAIGAICAAIVRWRDKRFMAGQNVPAGGGSGTVSRQPATENDLLHIVAPASFLAKLAWAISIWIGLFGLGLVVVYILTDILGFSTHRWDLTKSFGSMLGLIFVGLSAYLVFFLANPAFKAHLTINLLKKTVSPDGTPKGVMHAYGPGLHLLLPWEDARPEHLINIGPVRIEMEEKIAALTGGSFLVKGSFLFIPRLHQIAQYLRSGKTDEERKATIKGMVTDALASTLAAEIGPKDADDVQGELERIKAKAIQAYDDNEANLEDVLGIEVKELHISLDPDASIENARQRAYEMEKFKKMSEGIEKIDENARRDTLTFLKELPQSRHVEEKVIKIIMPDEMKEIAKETLKNPKVAEGVTTAAAAYFGAQAGSGGKSGKEKKG
jgi:hypothetical protein